MTQTRQPGPTPGASQRRRARGTTAQAVSRTFYLDAGTNAQLVRVADRLGWTVSRALDRLVQVSLLPYREGAALDVDALARRLVQVEADVELERVGAPQDA